MTWVSLGSSKRRTLRLVSVTARVFVQLRRNQWFKSLNTLKLEHTGIQVALSMCFKQFRKCMTLQGENLDENNAMHVISFGFVSFYGGQEKKPLKNWVVLAPFIFISLLKGFPTSAKRPRTHYMHWQREYSFESENLIKFIIDPSIQVYLHFLGGHAPLSCWTEGTAAPFAPPWIRHWLQTVRNADHGVQNNRSNLLLQNEASQM